MGQVFAGIDTEGRTFAFKVLRSDLTSNPNVVSRFLQERAILVGLRHPHLVGVHDLVVEGDTVAIVMDLVNGGDLRRYLTEAGTLLPSEVARFGAETAAALAAVHQAGVVHRDVKPENILIDRSTAQPAARLTDFGISRLASSSEVGRSSLLAGTPQYVAPELADGAEPTPAADLYSLGIVLYELCCGVTPFAGGSMLAVIRQHAEQEPGRPDGIPDPLWELISWLLAKGPRSRPQSAQQVATLLEALAVELRGAPVARRLTAPPTGRAVVHNQTTQSVAGWPSGTGPNPAGAPSPQRGRTRRLVLTAVAVTALLLLGVGAAAALRSSGGESGGSGGPDGSGSANGAGADAGDGPSSSARVTTTARPSTTAAELKTAPDLVGKALADARGVLPSSIKVETVDTVDESKTDGTVVAQDPKPGDPLNGRIQLTVARKPVLLYLDSLGTVNGEWDDTGGTALSGKPYLHAVKAHANACIDPHFVEYNLSRGYRRLLGTVGVEDNAEDATLRMQLEVFADGRLVATIPSGYGTPAPVDVDIAGALRLKLQWEPANQARNCYGIYENYLVIGEARLLGLPSEVPSTTATTTG